MCLCCLFVNANEGPSFNLQERQLWSTLYSGNFSLGHKLFLSCPCSSMTEEIINHLKLSYLYHRIGRDDQVIHVFTGIDVILENYLQSSD